MEATLAGGIELEKVSFRYNDKSPPVVQDVSLRIEPGQLDLHDLVQRRTLDRCAGRQTESR